MSKTSDENTQRYIEPVSMTFGFIAMITGLGMAVVLITKTSYWFDQFDTSMAVLVFGLFTLLMLCGLIVGGVWIKGAFRSYELAPPRELRPGEAARLDSNLRATRRRPRG